MKVTRILILLLLFVPLAVSAQQEAMYTQYMFNKLLINPGYAGSRAATSITALYRDQWTGFDGAPRTATLSAHGHLRNPKIALGLTVINDRLGISNQTGIYGTYAYRAPIGKGRLSIGVQGGIDHMEISLSSATHIDAGDPTLAADISRIVPNVGAGVYYQSKRFYAGVSAQRLIENKWNGNIAETAEAALEGQVRHGYAMVGGMIRLTQGLEFRPAVLVKYVANAPVQADFNASFLFVERVWAGVSYRTNASVDFMMEYQVNRQLRIGYAYDHQLGALGLHTNGSHEVLLGIDLDFSKTRIVTPRQMGPRYF